MEYKSEGSHDSFKLINYIRILLRRKFFLLGIILVTIGAVGIVSQIGPRIFTVETVIQIGQIEGQNVELPAQIVEKINDRTYSDSVALQLNVSVRQLPEINAKYIDNTELIRISADVQNIDNGKEILNALSTGIIKDHQITISERRDFLEKEIAQFTKRQQIAENAFGKGLNSTGMTESAQFLIMNSIQSRIDSLQDRINADRKALYGTVDTQIIKAPTDSSAPSSPRLPTIIILAGIFGLIFGIFIILVREWWDSSKTI